MQTLSMSGLFGAILLTFLTACGPGTDVDTDGGDTNNSDGGQSDAGDGGNDVITTEKVAKIEVIEATEKTTTGGHVSWTLVNDQNFGNYDGCTFEHWTSSDPANVFVREDLTTASYDLAEQAPGSKGHHIRITPRFKGVTGIPYELTFDLEPVVVDPNWEFALKVINGGGWYRRNVNGAITEEGTFEVFEEADPICASGKWLKGMDSGWHCIDLQTMTTLIGRNEGKFKWCNCAVFDRYGAGVKEKCQAYNHEQLCRDEFGEVAAAFTFTVTYPSGLTDTFMATGE